MKPSPSKLIALLIVLLFAPMGSPLLARGDQDTALRRATKAKVQRSTSYTYRYEGGQLVEQLGTVYGEKGSILGYEEIVYNRSDTQRLESMEYRYLNIDSELTRISTTNYLYEGKKRLGYDRISETGEGALITRHEVRYHVQVKNIGQVEETKVFNKNDELREIRYTIVDRNEKGRIIARDISAFDPQGIQIRRGLTTYGFNRSGELLGETRERFNADDDIVSREVADIERPDEHTTVYNWTRFNSEDEISGYRELSYSRNGSGKVESIKTIYFGADGEATSSRLESIAYDGDGHRIGRRTHVENY